MNFITNKLMALNKKFAPQKQILIKQLEPIKNYWLRQTQRDQQILIIASAFVGLLIIVYIISSAVNYTNSLQQEYDSMSAQSIDVQVIARQYNDLSQSTPNDFSSVNSDRIRQDANQILEDKNADVIISDNVLTIKADSIKFDNAMLFLDELRKSYGLFPDMLKITKLPQAGYVSFNVSFNNVNQQQNN
jgi:type II secretory pathway component PulM